MTALIDALSPEQWQLVFAIAVGVFFLVALSVSITGLAMNLNNRRHKPKFEPRAVRLAPTAVIDIDPADRPTQELPVIPQESYDDWTDMTRRYPTFNARMKQIAEREIP